jgi:hypothetical protein
MVRLAASIRGGIAGAAVAAWVALAACQPATPQRTSEPTPAEEPSPEPEVARFQTGLNLLRASGFTCGGLDGPWKVEITAPSPIQGSQRVNFRIPEKGPGRLKWSFEAQHPGQGLVTYAGDVKVRLQGPEEVPVLTFSGEQTAVGVTSKLFGRAKVNLDGACPR